MRKFWLLPVLIVSGLVLDAKAADAPIQSYNTYKSWLVACDNTLNCVAKGFNQEGDRAEFSITRGAGPQGKISAFIGSEAHFGPGDIKVDGAPVSLGSGWQRKDDQDGTTLSTSSFVAVRQFVQSIRNGKAIDLPENKTIPLDGFAAALLRMDARQGRAGGVTALLKPGAQSASAVPPAPSVPTIPAHPITAALAKGEAEKLITATRQAGAKVLSGEECDDKFDTMQPSAYALNDTRALVLIPCIMGAYQGSYIGFLTDRQNSSAAELSLPSAFQGVAPDQATTKDLTEADFDPKTATLAMAAKGRGLADCGMSASWIWDGHVFVLSALAYQDACGGMNPGDWPTLFRSKQ
jgi:hypothetical protein